MQEHIVKSFDKEIKSLRDKITLMAKSCEDQINGATQAFVHMDAELAQNIIKGDSHINRFQREIEDNAVRFLAKRHPLAVDLRQILSAMKIASELERIGDYTANIAKRIANLSEKPLSDASDLIMKMAQTCKIMLHDAIDAFLSLNIKQAVAVWQKDDEIDGYFSEMMTMLQEQMQYETTAINDCTQLIFMGRCFERIGDHITNIAENIYYVVTGQNYIDQLEE
ncbi:MULTISPECIES: phosphate signaling complex protein PhoU [Desulfobacula]|uniref:Phosphate-specific transport system accessory protein PhoU n=2 Tax=Desulfobacula TaxID=28222 RepID=K0NIV9_DESTT|nr:MULTISPECIES: phosphate signaling complex protein PhoU [Desulfobacula]CCK81366.1 PhoU: phosphate transport system protein [Desulfobacula toluolica Tol2]SDU26352.1 phosphate transport system protein [Desulfobacula phenolica]